MPVGELANAHELAAIACIEDWCGDGDIQAINAFGQSENCDDGGSDSAYRNGDGCSADCQIEFCGDGIAQPALDEDCDGGEHCTPECRWIPCEPHVIEVDHGFADDIYGAIEVIDPHGRVAASHLDWWRAGERRTLSVTLAPGDWTLRARKVGLGSWLGTVRLLDPAGLERASLEVPPELDALEQTVTIDACNTEWCGDGVEQVELDEECDDGFVDPERTAGDGCSPACAIELCGDGVPHAGLGEDCDDHNEQTGDGCDPDCGFEACAAHELTLVTGTENDRITVEITGPTGRIFALTPAEIPPRGVISWPVGLADGPHTLDIRVERAGEALPVSVELRRADGRIAVGHRLRAIEPGHIEAFDIDCDATCDGCAPGGDPGGCLGPVQWTIRDIFDVVEAHGDTRELALYDNALPVRLRDGHHVLILDRADGRPFETRVHASVTDPDGGERVWLAVDPGAAGGEAQFTVRCDRFCGDGVTQPGRDEACDGGTCGPDCTAPATCAPHELLLFTGADPIMEWTIHEVKGSGLNVYQ